MKTIRFRKRILLVLLMFLLGIFLMATACEPGGYITIDNQRDQEVTIVYTHARTDGTLGEATVQDIIPANTTSKFGITFLGSDWVQWVEAKDPSGKVVFSHDYRIDDLEKINWRITIPP